MINRASPRDILNANKNKAIMSLDRTLQRTDSIQNVPDQNVHIQNDFDAEEDVDFFGIKNDQPSSMTSLQKKVSHEEIFKDLDAGSEPASPKSPSKLHETFKNKLSLTELAKQRGQQQSKVNLNLNV